MLRRFGLFLEQNADENHDRQHPVGYRRPASWSLAWTDPLCFLTHGNDRRDQFIQECAIHATLGHSGGSVRQHVLCRNSNANRRSPPDLDQPNSRTASRLCVTMPSNQRL